MKQRYYYHEHRADYTVVKARGLKSRGELYGSHDFDDFSSRSFLQAMLPRLMVDPGARVLERESVERCPSNGVGGGASTSP